ncbi:MAG: hypothetical protein ACJAVI_003553 [Candidatus Azotimanducaceae bacterium]|jgi:hypothetical protein
MPKHQTDETKESVTAAVLSTAAKRLVEMLESPFGSAIIATAITTLAIASVLTGMGIVNLILY